MTLNYTATELVHCLQDLEDVYNNLYRSNCDNFERHLLYFLRFFRENKIASSILTTLPNVNFDFWYNNANTTNYKLKWPKSTQEEMALRLSLIQYIENGQENVHAFCTKFMYAGRRYDDSIKQFTEQIIAPFVKDFKKILRDMCVKQQSITNTSHTYANNKIFLVHGHDDAVKENVARFLEKIKLKVIILHEQANNGQTIIEKVEQYSDVGFAIILLTADDNGGRKGERPRARARQNVILEYGFFLGKLGRKRVAALYQDDIELPSDLHGLLYTRLDKAGGWRINIAKDLDNAGLPIDMNLLLEKVS